MMKHRYECSRTAARESLGFSSAVCVVVEDPPAGIKAGKGAGSRVIAFPATVSVPELQKARPDCIVEYCSALALQSVNDQLTFNLQQLPSKMKSRIVDADARNLPKPLITSRRS